MIVKSKKIDDMLEIHDFKQILGFVVIDKQGYIVYVTDEPSESYI